MTAKEELKQYLDKVRNCDRTIKEYEKYLTRATKMTAIMSEMASRTNLPSDKVGDNAAKMADLTMEYSARWFDAEKTRMELVKEIDKVGGVLGDILYDLYIEGLDMTKTAEDVKYSYDRATHLHGIALQVFERRNDNVNNESKQGKTAKPVHTRRTKSRHTLK